MKQIYWRKEAVWQNNLRVHLLASFLSFQPHRTAFISGCLLSLCDVAEQPATSSRGSWDESCFVRLLFQKSRHGQNALKCRHYLAMFLPEELFSASRKGTVCASLSLLEPGFDSHLSACQVHTNGHSCLHSAAPVTAAWTSDRPV